MASISSNLFIDVLIACFLLLLSEIRCDKTYMCVDLEKTMKPMIYTASEDEEKRLLCDLNGDDIWIEDKGDRASYEWSRYLKNDDGTSSYKEWDVISKQNKHDGEKFGIERKEDATEMNLVIKDFNTATDNTWWCCVSLGWDGWNPRANYRVLYIEDENIQVDITPRDSQGLVVADVDSEETLTCTISASLLDAIDNPIITWESPNNPDFDFGPKDSKEITLKMSADMNGMEIQCGYSYERGNMGGSALVFKSPLATLDIQFPTELDESSTPNEEPLTVEIGTDAELVVAFTGNPLGREDMKESWKVIKAKIDDGGQCAVNNISKEIALADSDKTVIKSDTEGIKDGIKFTLTIKDFSVEDKGCYIFSATIGESVIERPFWVIDLFIPPFRTSTGKPRERSTLKPKPNAAPPISTHVSLAFLVPMLFFRRLLAALLPLV